MLPNLIFPVMFTPLVLFKIFCWCHNSANSGYFFQNRTASRNSPDLEYSINTPSAISLRLQSGVWSDFHSELDWEQHQLLKTPINQKKSKKSRSRNPHVLLVSISGSMSGFRLVSEYMLPDVVHCYIYKFIIVHSIVFFQCIFLCIIPCFPHALHIIPITTVMPKVIMHVKWIIPMLAC